MNIYLGIKYHADGRNRPRIEAICRAIEQHGHTTTCIVRDLERWGKIHFSPQELMQKTFAVIEASDLSVIDLTEKGVGLGIEAGFAHARGIPVFTIAQAGSDISTTLAGISQAQYLYAGWKDLAAFFGGLGV